MLEYNVSCLLVLIWLKEKEANRPNVIHCAMWANTLILWNVIKAASFNRQTVV